nr:diguanylate cyclase [uncultured Ruegeria sp.]
MSVQGTILVLDGASTDRIMLKVQLTAAWYHVVQGEKLEGLKPLLRRVRPDLVLTALALADGTAADVKRLIQNIPDLGDIPVVAIAPQNDKAARLEALSAGLDDVLAHPFKDNLLMARVRSLLRMRADVQDLQFKEDTLPIGFAEPPATLIAPTAPSRVAILAPSHRTGASWCRALQQQTHHYLSKHTQSNLKDILSGPVPDAIVVDLNTAPSSLNVLADLRSRSATRHTVLIGVLDKEHAPNAAEALDRGADAVCLGDFCAREIALRLDSLIARKSRTDQMRASLRRGLADSWVDPLTGLNNRRFAMQAVGHIVRQSRHTGRGCALMLADLDHFKAINDRYGHAAGDHVLTEAARRMRNALGPRGFVARFGGEEFMIGVSDATNAQALNLADAMCRSIRERPFSLPDQNGFTQVTTSIGLNVFRPPYPQYQTEHALLDSLIKSADKALYAAKKAGRNQISTRQSAA